MGDPKSKPTEDTWYPSLWLLIGVSLGKTHLCTGVSHKGKRGKTSITPTSGVL